MAEKIMTDKIEGELFQIRNIVGLSAFAAEARRVLSGLDQVVEMHPATGNLLSQLISSPRNWHEYGDFSGDVLNDVRQRLDDLLGDECRI